MSEQDIPPREQTKAELMRRNQRAFEELEELIAPLDDDQLSQPGPDGWAIKDHLGHLAAWQLGIVALLQGRPRYAAMGVHEADGGRMKLDELNAAVQRNLTGKPAAELKEMVRDAHRQMAHQIDAMSNEDLFKPYKGYDPTGEDGADAPVLYTIVGNAYGHYDEHIEWIRQRLAEQ